MTGKERAVMYHDMGYDCAQSVACAYCEKAGVDPETMFIIMEGFGRGMGGMEGTCGAISGAVAVAGAMNSSANLEKPDSKQSTYELSRQIIGRFREKNGATVCRELKGIETGTVLRPCQGCIEDACDILEEVIPETGD
jgi:C_GCAxxG_C_C family probable redox protein